MKDRTMITHDKNGNEMTVAVRSALPVDSPCARYTGFKQETLLLKKGSVRLKGYMPLPCDIILERDVPVRSGTVSQFIRIFFAQMIMNGIRRLWR